MYRFRHMQLDESVVSRSGGSIKPKLKVETSRFGLLNGSLGTSYSTSSRSCPPSPPPVCPPCSGVAYPHQPGCGGADNAIIVLEMSTEYRVERSNSRYHYVGLDFAKLAYVLAMVGLFNTLIVVSSTSCSMNV
ncbi:hypothetical protein M9H77_33692 [Catharanthus roseus]|uniref:Uncharacterized protein n=1 Tax=Catharanthus roseus TaxID=4058 RepID=A0ACB9ZNA7_CATRO|nr:hypothetical protein M9H77_33692 [Catharanthus roseus]